METHASSLFHFCTITFFKAIKECILFFLLNSFYIRVGTVGFKAISLERRSQLLFGETQSYFNCFYLYATLTSAKKFYPAESVIFIAILVQFSVQSNVSFTDLTFIFVFCNLHFFQSAITKKNN